MSDTAKEPEAAYHLFLDLSEVPVAASALRLLISDEAHEPQIRGLAREVIASLQGTPDEHGKLTVELQSWADEDHSHRRETAAGRSPT